MDVFDVLLKVAGVVVVAGGGAAALILGPLRYLADKWLTSKFNQRLEQFKHAQQVEMEFKINSLFDRTTKLHQREFEVVPTAWALLVECKNQVSAIITALQQYPDLDRMTDPQLDEFLEGSFLAKWQRDEIKTSAKKADYYMKAVFFHRAGEARAACREQHVYVLKNGIFMPSDMKEKFDSGCPSDRPGGRSRRILLMTFSRRAASEMTKRVERIAHKVMGDNAGVMTDALTWASAPGCCASTPNRSAWIPPLRFMTVRTRRTS
jgi:hypothetical protein